MPNLYFQCLLCKTKDKEVLSTTSFIPEKFAYKNKILKLKQEDGVWEDGWKVVEVYGSSFTEKQLELKEWKLTKRK